ncbi:hypothetical protein VB264_10595 [Arcicella aquatica]|uniref:Uncharacterized protein n=1 Tax=Arcicella aquatica TaxID=217141 RepID=A0ABU5QMI2_9BACT|nr:hypothetical protein [Arcicella aquatica]MEA5258228.1 hypothetical protein [Arcicella aquatica]
MREELIKQLEILSQDEWNKFIKQISFNKEVEPNTEFLGDDLPSILLNLYRTINKLNKSILQSYNNAIIYNLKTIDKINSNSQIIYTYLYFVHETKPFEHKKTLTSVLYEDKLKKMFYGSSNLEELLLKSLILLEDSNNPILLEKISNLKLNDYYIYLRILYFSQINLINLSLADFEFILTGKKILSEYEGFIYYNANIDIIPNKITLTDFTKHLHKNCINISNNINLKNALNKVIDFWKNKLFSNSPLIDMLILHLEDYFNKKESNANLYPKLIDIIYEYDTQLGLTISNYYNDQKYNSRESINRDEFFKNILDSY